jgi:hypothetical protein
LNMIPEFAINRMRKDPSKEDIVLQWDKAKQLKINSLAKIKEMAGGSVSNPIKVGGRIEASTKLDVGLKKFEESGAPPEKVEAVKRVLSNPKARGIFDKVIKGMKDWDAVAFMNKLADRIAREEETKPKPFEVDTQVAP